MNTKIAKVISLSTLFGLILVTTACGGGGGASPSTSPNPAPEPTLGSTPSPSPETEPSPLPSSTPDVTPSPVPNITPTPIPDPTPNPTPGPIDNSSALYELPEGWAVDRVGDIVCDVNAMTSEQRQRYTQSMSKAFVWITGTREQAHYEPIGEVANYFGFAALRSLIRERDGELADVGFRGALQFEVLELLDNEQRQILYDALAAHRPDFESFLDQRLVLVNRVWDLKDNIALDFDSIDLLIEEIGRLEARITVTTAEHYARLKSLLRPDQLDYLVDIRNGIVSVEDMEASVLPFSEEADEQYDALSSFEKDLISEIATKFASWSVGTVEESIYLPNGKIGNYFGFAHYRYIDRANVSRSLAASYIEAVLDEQQLSLMCGLALSIEGHTQDYIHGREDLIRTLFPLQNGAIVNVDEAIEDYANLAGMGEGRRVILDALYFLLLESSLREAQITEMNAFR